MMCGCSRTTPRRRRPHPAGAVVMLHGWEGDANALYMLSLARRLLARGFEILRLKPARPRRHAAAEPGPVPLVSAAGGDRRRAPCPTAVSRGCRCISPGFSLGGNFLLRVAADAGAGRADSRQLRGHLAGARTARHDDGDRVRRVDLSPLLRQEVEWLIACQAARVAAPLPVRYVGPRFEPAGDDRRAVARYTDFGSLEEYLDGYSITGERLARLTVPATIITARG